MKTVVYSHRSGVEVVSIQIVDEVRKIFGNTSESLKRYANRSFKEDILLALKRGGWSDIVKLDETIANISITSMRDRIGLCFQTGNVARMYADLLKLQVLYRRGTVRCGIVIVPTRESGEHFGSNCATYERLSREMPIFDQAIDMPLVIIGFYE